jgi:hypothetical protein
MNLATLLQYIPSSLTLKNSQFANLAKLAIFLFTQGKISGLFFLGVIVHFCKFWQFHVANSMIF